MSSPLNAQQIKDFGNVVTLILLIAIYFFDAYSLIGFALLSTILTLTFYKLYTPFAKIWFGMSHVLGGVTNKLVLGIVFFVFVVPIGFVLRLLSKDSMQLSAWKKDQNSVFSDTITLYQKEDLEQPY